MDAIIIVVDDYVHRRNQCIVASEGVVMNSFVVGVQIIFHDL
jgi:hypothetical protein